MRKLTTLVVLALTLAACATGSDSDTSQPTSSEAATTVAGETDQAFPVTVAAMNGQVTIESQPMSIISLSPSATENLFAVGGGGQVVAVDDQSNYPAEAPTTELSGFTPNLESILDYEPDLVIITYDPGGLIDGLEEVGVPVILLPSATSLDDAFEEIEVLGVATGHVAEAAEVVSRMQQDLDAIVSDVGSQIEGTTIYHELDPTYYSVSSWSFVGELYGLLGLVNIADEADPDATGYPQLAAEYIVASDPDVILLADAGFGESIETLKERPGWAEMTAITSEAVVNVDPDLSSRWTPRSMIFLRDVAEAIASLVPVG